MSRNKRPSAAKEIHNRFTNLGANNTNWSINSAMDTQIQATNFYRRKLSELAINRFKWYGLPATVNQRFLEVTLFQNALSVFFFDMDRRASRSIPIAEKGPIHTASFLSLRASTLGFPNMQDDPTAFRVFREPLPSIVLGMNDCVPIWANSSRTPDHDMVEYYARRLANWDTTLEINALNARQTKIISANQDSLLTLQNAQRQIVEGEPAIYVSDKSTVADSVSVLDMGIDVMGLEKLSIVRGRVWSEAMTMLGINAAMTEKKERVTDDEVAQNDDQVQTNRAIYLNERQAAAERINRKYGLNVKVEYRSDIDGVADSVFRGAYNPNGGK